MDNEKNKIKPKLKKYAKLVSNEFDVNKILLYGSFYKDTQRKDSDIDVAVLVNLTNKKKKIEITKRLYLLARQVDIRIEPRCIFMNELIGLEPASILSDILRNSEEISLNY